MTRFPLSALSRALWGCGVLAATAPGWAQSAAGAPPVAAPASAPAATPAAGPVRESAGTTLQTIVVTAQKRSQNVKEVPVAVSVVGSEQLAKQGIRDIGDLAKAVASLEFGDQQTGGAGGSASIRGIGTAVFTTSAESSVGVVVDGVPMGNTAGGSLFDLQRVEVLRGPQGTLFGKNASAGVLNMVTQAPVLKRLEGSVSTELSGGQVTSLQLRGALNVPVNDISALRITAHADRLTGVYENVHTGRDSETRAEGLRVRYLLRPSSEVSVNLIAEHDTTTRQHAVFFAPAIASAANTAGNHRPLAEFAACGVTVNRENNQVCSDSPEHDRARVQGVSGQLDWTLGNGLTLTSITAWRERQTGPNAAAIDMSLGYDKIRATDGVIGARQVSQELRLASPAKATLEWVAGLFYSDYEADKRNTTTIHPPTYLPSPPVPRSIATRAENSTQLSSLAAFGQATYRVNELLGVVGGLRYTRDKAADHQVRRADVAFAGFAVPTELRSASGSTREANLSGKLGLQFALAAGTNAYLTLTRGYKGPQIDTDTPIGALTGAGSATGSVVRPEIPTSLEAGLKTTLLDRRLDLDLAVFRTRIRDFQEQNCTLTPVGALNCIPLNVPQVTSSGLEFDLRARPVAGLTLTASGALILGTEYPAGFRFDGNDVGGQRLLYSPKAKLSLGAEYALAVLGDHEWTVGADLTYKTRVRYCNTLAEGCGYQGHAIFGLRISLRSPDDRWGVTLFARNLGDERVPSAILYPLPGKGAGSGYAYALGPNAFRSIGLSADLKF